ncbi:MAG: hypothetical protein FD124_230, partial [Alphaproteobacteria bacterium]
MDQPFVRVAVRFLAVAAVVLGLASGDGARAGGRDEAPAAAAAP